MAIRSIELSPAARRRTSDWRWESASVPSRLTLILYSPLECCEQYSAAFWNEPPGWLPAHQLSVTAPDLSDEPPHAATANTAAASARTEMTRLDMASGSLPNAKRPEPAVRGAFVERCPSGRARA